MHPRDLPPCDLVMKGGVTSGVVYPGAMLELSTRYRFEKLGGASVGAVAAALAAASEYARQRAERIELGGLEDVVEQLKQPGLVPSLFQPAPAARPLLAIALALRSTPRSHWHQTRVLAGAALEHRPWSAVAATLGAAAILALLAAAFQQLSIVPASVLAALGAVGVMLLASWAVLGPLVSMARGVWRSLPELGFGICPGTRQGAGAPDGLTDWMHAIIQHCAELPLDQPLTFAMLESQGIGLQMVGTDLGLARPVTIPFTEEQYLFAPAELRRLFPDPVVDCVLAAAGVPASERGSSRTWFLPAKQLPIVIGARLSSCVPLMLSSLRLYSALPEAGAPLESFISDGGITSNFPIHFFDDWLPSHPTFGLDLVRGADATGPDVYMPRTGERGPLARSSAVHSVGAFLRQIEDASRNWRDQLQAELPGNRERICQIRVRPGEGGFNLSADPDMVTQLLDRGRRAGREILQTFDWDQHRFVRYAVLMELLQDNLSLLAQRFASYQEWLSRSGSRLPGQDPQWFAEAQRATAELLEHAPTGLRFEHEQGRPQPEPAMRIGPRV